jgi:hypothetical protein
LNGLLKKTGPYAIGWAWVMAANDLQPVQRSCQKPDDRRQRAFIAKSPAFCSTPSSRVTAAESCSGQLRLSGTVKLR